MIAEENKAEKRWFGFVEIGSGTTCVIRRSDLVQLDWNPTIKELMDVRVYESGETRSVVASSRWWGFLTDDEVIGFFNDQAALQHPPEVMDAP